MSALVRFRPSGRHVVLAGLLALTLVATFWPQGEPEDAVIEAVHDRPVERNAPPAVSREVLTGTGPAISIEPDDVNVQRGHGSSRTAEEPPEPRLASDLHRDLFPAHTFKPPPPKPEPPPPPPPPPPPTAPAVPFVFLGAWTEDGRETLFLGRGQQTFTVQRGELLPGGWRLDEVTPDALTLTYISLNQQRILRIAP